VNVALGRAVLDAHAAALDRAAPGARWVVLEPDGSWSGDPDTAEAALLSIGLTRTPETAAQLPRMLGARSLRWLQSGGAGFDDPVFAALLQRGVRLTNAAGIHAEPIAQYIFTYILHWERNVAAHLAQQRARTWEIIVSDDLSAKTLGIVGLGGIGLAAARIGRAFGMRVLGLRRTRGAWPDVDLVFGPDDLEELLRASHYVVLALPLSAETRHTIGAAELATMRGDAVLINVARGGVVDEAALIETLRAGAIRGAVLDVTETEPLPADSPLWTLERCLVTPHDAGYSPLGDERLAHLFTDNLARFVRGEPLRNEVPAEVLATKSSPS
jgi:phosphoglycerate dehydrogenase-like enzyme